MEPVKYKAQPAGGFIRVNRFDNGKNAGTVVSVNTRHAGDQIARALNEAYAAGVARGEQDGAKKAKDEIADMLDSRFGDGAEGEFVRGWRDAIEYVRAHIPGGFTSLV